MITSEYIGVERWTLYEICVHGNGSFFLCVGVREIAVKQKLIYKHRTKAKAISHIRTKPTTQINRERREREKKREKNKLKFMKEIFCAVCGKVCGENNLR